MFKVLAATDQKAKNVVRLVRLEQRFSHVSESHLSEFPPRRLPKTSLNCYHVTISGKPGSVNITFKILVLQILDNYKSSQWVEMVKSEIKCE